MARGRMLDATLASSKKMSGLPERAFAVYVLTLANTDVQGRFDADEMSLLGYAGRYGIARGWTEESIAADRKALHDCGLWIVWGHGDDTFGQVTKFHAHNRTDPADEAASKIPEPEGYSDKEERQRYNRPPYHRRKGKLEPKGDRRPAAESPQSSPGPAVPERVRARARAEPEPEPEPEPEAEAEAAGGSGGGGSNGIDRSQQVRPDHEERAQRLVDAWGAAHVRVNEASAADGLKPLIPAAADFYEATALARTIGSTVDLFAGDLLVQELARVVVCFDEKGLNPTFRVVVKQLGQRFPGTRHPDPVLWRE